MSEQEIEYIKRSVCDESRPLTTVVGIKCIDGIIHFTLVDALKLNLGQNMFDKEPDLINQIDECLTSLHKKYNVDRSFRLGFQQVSYFFMPNALLGVRLADGSFGLYRLTLEPWIESIDDYTTIGSGYLLANLILNQQSRFLKNTNKKLSHLSLFYNLWIASYTINEVKAIEPYTGGNTRVAFINNEGFTIMDDKQVSGFYQYTIEQMAGLFGDILKNKEIENIFKRYYPKP